MGLLRLDEVRARIEAQVPDLNGKLGNAADFAELVDKNLLKQHGTGGYVLPGGLAGGRADVISGLFRQAMGVIVKVVLAVRVAGDPLRDKAIDAATPLATDIITAVAGWAPDDAVGVFELVRGELVGATGGVLLFEIDFRLNDQLRITP